MAEAVARVEIAAMRRRCFVMPVTSGDELIIGQPTLWSAVVDALAAGRTLDPVRGELAYLDSAAAPDAQRLFLVSAGNIPTLCQSTTGWLDRCDLETVEDPAQAWNVLTVGAFTEKDHIADPTLRGWRALAPRGELSPWSRTSVAFNRSWPIKPDIVMEGGTPAVDPAGQLDSADDLMVLTTHHAPSKRWFTVSNATSAATSQAGWLAGQIIAHNPGWWPETVRGLMVHAARWTPAMMRHIKKPRNKKADILSLVRRYGFGVPTLERCLHSAQNALTLIAQRNDLRPFRDSALCEMHLYELPWPCQVLESLGEAQVRLRVTLSYFVEPHPGRRGGITRYRYASHQLRFELRRPTESTAEFTARINKASRDEGWHSPKGSDPGWLLGVKARTTGSLHCDEWSGTASELAARGVLAVFPALGWWKERADRDRSQLGARYALLISIETDREDIDLWSPVAQQVELALKTPIEIETF